MRYPDQNFTSEQSLFSTQERADLFHEYRAQLRNELIQENILSPQTVDNLVGREPFARASNQTWDITKEIYKQPVEEEFVYGKTRGGGSGDIELGLIQKTQEQLQKEREAAVVEPDVDKGRMTALERRYQAGEDVPKDWLLDETSADNIVDYFENTKNYVCETSFPLAPEQNALLHVIVCQWIA